MISSIGSGLNNCSSRDCLCSDVKDAYSDDACRLW